METQHKAKLHKGQWCLLVLNNNSYYQYQKTEVWTEWRDGVRWGMRTKFLFSTWGATVSEWNDLKILWQQLSRFLLLLFSQAVKDRTDLIFFVCSIEKIICILPQDLNFFFNLFTFPQIGAVGGISSSGSSHVLDDVSYCVGPTVSLCYIQVTVVWSTFYITVNNVVYLSLLPTAKLITAIVSSQHEATCSSSSDLSLFLSFFFFFFYELHIT